MKNLVRYLAIAGLIMVTIVSAQQKLVLFEEHTSTT